MDIENLTRMVDDPFSDADFSFNDTFRMEYTPWERILMIYDVVMGLLKFVICLAGIVSNVILMYVFAKHKRLRTRSNYYILHFAINSCMYYTVAPLLDLTVELFVVGIFNSYIYCISFEIEGDFLFMYLMFGLALCADWYILNFKVHWMRTYQIIYKYPILIIYAIGAVKIIVDVAICVTDSMFTMKNILLPVAYVVVFLIVAIVNILKYRSEKNNNVQLKCVYCLKASNVIVFSWMPMFVFHIITLWIWHDFDSVTLDFLTAIQIIMSLLELVTYASPIYVIYILGRSNKYFKMAYDKIFKRFVSTYTDDDLDDYSEEPELTANDAPPESSPAQTQQEEVSNILIY